MTTYDELFVALVERSKALGLPKTITGRLEAARTILPQLELEDDDRD